MQTESDEEYEVMEARVFGVTPQGSVRNINIDKGDQISLEYDTFSGSLEDNVTKREEDTFSFVSPNQSSRNLDEETRQSPINVLKTRNKNSVNESPEKPSSYKAMRNTSSAFTAKKIPKGFETPQQKSTEKLMQDYETLGEKIEKIEKELKFVDQYLPPDYQASKTKLAVAREKLSKKCEVLKKEQYDLSIKIHYRWKKIDGSHGEGDRTHFWVRSVSS